MKAATRSTASLTIGAWPESPATSTATGMCEAALERLEAEFGDVGVVLALGRFDQLRTDKTTKIDRRSHDGVSVFGSFRPDEYEPETLCLAPNAWQTRKGVWAPTINYVIRKRAEWRADRAIVCIPVVLPFRPPVPTSNRARRRAVPARRSGCSSWLASRARGR